MQVIGLQQSYAVRLSTSWSLWVLLAIHSGVEQGLDRAALVYEPHSALRMASRLTPFSDAFLRWKDSSLVR